MRLSHKLRLLWVGKLLVTSGRFPKCGLCVKCATYSYHRVLASDSSKFSLNKFIFQLWWSQWRQVQA